MSAVYRAFDSVMGREVAIKRLLPLEETNLNEAAGDVLASEAAALARFQHPNIVTVYAFEEDEDGPYVVMELVDGEDLYQVLQGGALSLEDFQDIAVQCLEPLISASELSLLHRDIKPGNIMLTMTPSERFLVKILDFGLAKFSQQPSTQTLDQAGSFLGSIDYIAPEQLELMPLDQRTDLYSLGCVLYYALAQKAPFSGDNPAQTSMNHLNHAVVPIGAVRPDVPEPVANWLMRLIARDPQERPASALEALQQFRLAGEGEAVEAAHSPLTGGVTPQDDPPGDTPTGDVPPPGGVSAPTETDSVRRPLIHTSPQVPRPGPTVTRSVPPVKNAAATGRVEWLRHPVTITGFGIVLLGVFLFSLFGGKKEEVEVRPKEEEPVPVNVAVEVENASGSGQFAMPDPFELDGDPVSLADLPADPPLLLRCASAEGMLGRDLEPASESGGKIAIWTNLKTRKKFHSLFPTFTDEFAVFAPVSGILSDRDLKALKAPTRAAMLNNRTALVTRTGPLPLERGVTVFFVGKMNPGSGRQIQIEPNAGGGEVAGIKIDFSGNAVGSTRLGGGMQEVSIKAPWGSSGAGVIAYGSSPAEGRHHLLSLPASGHDVSFSSGEYEAMNSPFQRLFLGRNDVNADPDGVRSTWIFEIVLYNQLLAAEQMEDISKRLSDFYFTRP
jgi:serine/threonine protein kinase